MSVEANTKLENELKRFRSVIVTGAPDMRIKDKYRFSTRAASETDWDLADSDRTPKCSKVSLCGNSRIPENREIDGTISDGRFRLWATCMMTSSTVVEPKQSMCVREREQLIGSRTIAPHVRSLIVPINNADFMLTPFLIPIGV